MNKKIKNKTTIIFDFDGTIGDSFNFFIQFYHNEFLKIGKDIEKEEVRKLLRNVSIKEILKKLGISKLKFLYIYYKFKKDFVNIGEDIKLFPEMRKLLFDLSKRYDLILLTSNDKEHTEKILKQNIELNYFNDYYFKSSLFGKAKYLKKILKNHNLEKGKVLYIGDELRDYEACKKINIDCLNVSYGFNSRKLLETENDLIVDSVKELRKNLL